MTALNSFTIPTDVREVLLPDPKCSISQILAFAMPSQLRMAVTTVNVAHFVSGQLPTFTDNINILKTWPIPSHNLLDNIQEKALEMHAMSIRYPHVPTSHPARQLHFPLWVFTYWKETSLLRTYVTSPWSGAELWLTKERTAAASYRSPDRCCEEAQAMFLAIPWAGDVHGFTEGQSPTRPSPMECCSLGSGSMVSQKYYPIQRHRRSTPFTEYR